MLNIAIMLFIIVTLVSIINLATCYIHHGFPRIISHLSRSKSIPLHGFKPGWNVTHAIYRDETSKLLNTPEFVIPGQLESKFSFHHQTLQEISKSRGFSLHYLGDFLVELGCKTPISINKPIETFLDGDQQLSFYTSICTIDPGEVNEGYLESYPVRNLCKELSIDGSQLLRLCHRCNVRLPYGVLTTPHITALERIKRMYEYDISNSFNITVGGQSVVSQTSDNPYDVKKVLEDGDTYNVGPLDDNEFGKVILPSDVIDD